MKQFVNNFKNNSNFSGTDSEKVFKKNLKKKPIDWIYRTKEITYEYNENGFRERPFDEINWSESVVLFGCSNIEGIGLANEDTLARRLEKIIDRPVVNLGIGGSGIDIACWNSTILHARYPKPKAVIQIWSSLDRYSDYQKEKYVPYMANLSGYAYRLNWENRSMRYILTDRQMWENDAIYIEQTFFIHPKHILEFLNLKRNFQVIDEARDLVHPGIESNQLAAEELAKILETYKI